MRFQVLYREISVLVLIENIYCMDNTVKERLIIFIRCKNLSQGRFEKLIGAGNGFVNNISKGIGAEKMQRILSEFPDLNPEWLLFNRGEMLKPSEPPKIMNYVTPPSTDVELNRDLLNQITRLTECVASQQRTIDHLFRQLQCQPEKTER